MTSPIYDALGDTDAAAAGDDRRSQQGAALAAFALGCILGDAVIAARIRRPMQ